MPNMSNVKVEMPSQNLKFVQLTLKKLLLGYTKEMAQEEATRCLNCKKSLVVWMDVQ